MGRQTGNSHLRRFAFLFCLWLLCGCNGKGPVIPTPKYGDGAGFDGGDPLITYLQSARALAFGELSTLSSTWDPNLCNVDDPTGLDPELYELANSMTTDQRSYCLDFVQNSLLTLPQVYNPNNPTPLEVTYTPISVTEGGLTFDVAAKTQPGISDEILFDGDLMNAYIAADATTTVQAVAPRVIQSLVHEFGHKLYFATYGGKVTDADPAGPFTEIDGGRHFLDKMAAAVALHLATSPFTAPASSCKLSQTVCTNYPGYTGTFYDNSLAAATDQATCLGRASYWDNYCGNPPGTVTTATFTDASGNLSSSTYAITSCNITQAECVNHPIYQGTFYDNTYNAASNQTECFARASDWDNYCGNPSGTVTTATFTDSSGNLSSRSFSMP